MKEESKMADTTNRNLTSQMHDSVVPVTGNDMAGIQASAMAQELMRKAVDNIQNTAPKYKVETPLVKPDTSQDGRYKLNVDTSFGAGIDLLKSSGLISDPRQRADKSKVELDSILKKIRSDASKTYYGNQQSNAPVWMKNQAEQTDYGTFGAPVKVNASQIYDTLKDNDTLLAKYPSYTPGMNNEEIAAMNQSTGQKWARGLGKLALKTGLYTLGGLTGTIYGIGAAIADWRFASLYDNSYQDWLDDQDQKLNHTLAHYYTQAEKEMNFFKKMGTANFWAADVIGDGLSFTTAAILSGYITGGLGVSGLGSAGIRAGFRAAAKKTASQVAAAATKASFSTVAKEVSKNAAKGNLKKTLFGLMPGTMYESAVEAYGAYSENEKQFLDYYRNVYGRTPTQEEYDEFRNINAVSTNKVWAANMGIVGLSNYLQLARYMGLDSRAISRALPGVTRSFNNIGRMKNRYLFGLGVKKAEDGTLKAINANWMQKAIGTTWNVSKPMLTEGFFEEGLQGVASTAAEDYVSSTYDLTRLKKYDSMYAALGDAIHKQYTTKEGLMEVGIGAIIGFGMGLGRGNLGGFTERRNQSNRIKAYVDEWNKNGAFTASHVKDAMKSSLYMNNLMSHADESYQQRSLYGDNNDASSEYAKFALSDNLGMLDVHADEFMSMIENMDNTELATEIGFSSADQAADYKKAVIEDYRRKLDNYKKSAHFADSITAEGKYATYKDMIGNVAYKGMESATRVDEISKQISYITGMNEYSEALKVLSTARKSTFEAAKNLLAAKEEIDKLNSEIETMAMNPNRVNAEGKDVFADAIKAKSEQVKKLNEEYQANLQKLNSVVSEDFSHYNFESSTGALINSVAPTAEQFLAAYDSVSAIESYIKSKNKSELTDTDQTLIQLVNEYKDNVVNMKNMRNLMDKFQDDRFMNEYTKGIGKLIRRTIKGQSSGLDFGDRSKQKVAKDESGNLTRDDSEIENAFKDGKITEDEYFTLMAFNHLDDGLTDNTSSVGDYISDDVYNALIENAQGVVPLNSLYLPLEQESILDSIKAKALSSGVDSLTDRERSLYDIYKEIDPNFGIEGTLEERLKNIEDRTNKYLNPENKKEANNNVIEIAKKGLSEEDAKELDNAIDKYRSIIIDGVQKDDMTEADLEALIELLGDQSGLGINILPFVKQNAYIDRMSSDSSTETIDNYGTDEKHVLEILNDTDSSSARKEANVNNAQNPLVLMVRKVSKGYEFSNLRPDRFADFIDKSLIKNVETVGRRGGFSIVIEFVDGRKVELRASNFNARFTISDEDVDYLRNSFGFVIPASSDYAFVMKDNSGGSGSLFYTQNGYGENGTDYIDQEALSEQKEGNEVVFEIDKNDSYNKELYDKYQKGSINERTFNDNVVIKVMSPDGRFLSVLSSGNSRTTSSIRTGIATRFSEDGDKIDLGSGRIVKLYPGRPVFNIGNDGSVSSREITESDLDNIVDVGYISNGEVNLKNNTKDFSLFPYTTSIMNQRDKEKADGGYKDVRVPVVVVKGKNGTNYVYPVSLKQGQSNDSDVYLFSANDIISDIDNGIDIGSRLDEINEINSYIRKLGLDSSEYEIPLNANSAQIKAALQKVIPVISNASSYPNVIEWMNDPRSVNDIVMNDVMLNTQPGELMFVAPKIRVSFSRDGEASNVSEMEDTDTDEDLPFGNQSKRNKSEQDEVEGQTATEEAVVEQTTNKQTVVETEATEQPETVSQETGAPAPTEKPKAVSTGRRSSKSNFKNKFEGGLDLKPVKNIADFICRKIAKGELVFLKDKKGDGLERFMADHGMTDGFPKGNRISNKSGMKLSDYIDWLKKEASNNDVVKAYVESRTEEQTYNDLAFILKSVRFTPTGAINYSLRLNGLPIVSENISEEESNKIFSEVNSILNAEGGTTDIDKVTDSVSDALENNNVNGAVQILTDSGFTEESAKKAIVDITEEIDNEDGTNKSELANNELNKEENGKGKEEKADQAGAVEGSDKSGTKENRPVAGEEDGTGGNADQDRRNEEPVVEEWIPGILKESKDEFDMPFTREPVFAEGYYGGELSKYVLGPITDKTKLKNINSMILEGLSGIEAGDRGFIIKLGNWYVAPVGYPKVEYVFYNPETGEGLQVDRKDAGLKDIADMLSQASREKGEHGNSNQDRRNEEPVVEEWISGISKESGNEFKGKVTKKPVFAEGYYGGKLSKHVLGPIAHKSMLKNIDSMIEKGLDTTWMGINGFTSNFGNWYVASIDNFGMEYVFYNPETGEGLQVDRKNAELKDIADMLSQASRKKGKHGEAYKTSSKTATNRNISPIAIKDIDTTNLEGYDIRPISEGHPAYDGVVEASKQGLTNESLLNAGFKKLRGDWYSYTEIPYYPALLNAKTGVVVALYKQADVKSLLDKVDDAQPSPESNFGQNDQRPILRDNEWMPGIEKQNNERTVHVLNVKSYVYASPESYKKLGVQTSPVSERDVFNSGILNAQNTVQLKRAGFSNKGYNWWIKASSMGVIDMYNIQTGEALRVQAYGSQIDANFIRRLSQDVRSLNATMDSDLSVNRTLEASDMNSSNKEINKPCSTQRKGRG